jgi:hypothetical protein
VSTTLKTLKIATAAGVQDYSSSIATYYGSNLLQASATLNPIRSFVVSVPSAPATIMVTLGGQDASGYQWTTEIPVPLVAGPQQFVDVSFGGGLANAASINGPSLQG